MKKVYLLYDSFFGNTEKIAHTIADALKTGLEVETSRVTETNLQLLNESDIVIVGAPTRVFSPSPEVKKFLKYIRRERIQGKPVAAFDTRIAESDIKSRFLRFMVKTFGYAARPIAKKLVKKGGVLITPPVGFIVKDTEGPLKKGELQRAANWGRKIILKLSDLA
ncbi:flavodoxin family protein [candidate division KSB1 bacterium]|nr:flavodoxin family protein [candidate division KSB1 bacterium]